MSDNCPTCGEPVEPGNTYCANHQTPVIAGPPKGGWGSPRLFIAFLLLLAVFLYPKIKNMFGRAEPVNVAPVRWATPAATPEGEASEAESVAPPQKAAAMMPTPTSPAADTKETLATKKVAAASSKSGTPAVAVAACGNGMIEIGEQCDGAALAGATCATLGFAGDCGKDGACVQPGLACLSDCSFDYSGCTAESQLAVQRFVDHKNGTISDRLAALMWEQKCGADDCAELHNVLTTRTWQAGATDWVKALNGENFAGHNDWRLPSVEELRMLLVAVPPCGDNICDAASVWDRKQTAPAGYWSSTTLSLDKSRAWVVSFRDGDVYTAEKGQPLHVRAVRRER